MDKSEYEEENEELEFEDINDYLIYYSIQLDNGQVVVPINKVRDALERYYYLEKE